MKQGRLKNEQPNRPKTFENSTVFSVVMPATPTLPPSTEPSWLSSIHGWLAKDDNWKYVLAVGAGTTILGGLGYYVYMSKQENGTPRSSSSKKKKSKSKTVKEEPPASTEKNHAETVVSDESDGFGLLTSSRCRNSWVFYSCDHEAEWRCCGGSWSWRGNWRERKREYGRFNTNDASGQS